MTFIVLTCPGCGRRILMDETDGFGHCMYCGVGIDASETDAECLDPQSAELVDVVINGTGDVPESYPPQIEEAVALLKEDDIDGSCRAFSEALAGQDADTVVQLKDSMAECAIRWVFRTVYEGKPYNGGLARMAGLLTVENEPSTEVVPMIESVFDGLCKSLTVIESPSDCVNMAKSLSVLLAEYMCANPRPSDVGDMLEEYVEQCDVLLDLLDQMEPEDPGYAKDVKRMRRTSERFDEAMYSAVSDAAAMTGDLGELEDRLVALGPSQAMADAASAFLQAMNGGNANVPVAQFERCIGMHLSAGL